MPPSAHKVTTFFQIVAKISIETSKNIAELFAKRADFAIYRKEKDKSYTFTLNVASAKRHFFRGAGGGGRKPSDRGIVYQGGVVHHVMADPVVPHGFFPQSQCGWGMVG